MTLGRLHDASTSADRGSNPRVPQPDPIRGQSRLACGNIGGGDPDLGGGLFGLGLGGDGPGQQLLGSPERSLRFGQHGSIAGQDCLTTGDLRLELAVVEAKQKVSSGNLRTVTDMPLNNGAVDAGPHSDT